MQYRHFILIIFNRYEHSIVYIITYEKMLCDIFHTNGSTPFLVAYLDFSSRLNIKKCKYILSTFTDQ